MKSILKSIPEKSWHKKAHRHRAKSLRQAVADALATGKYDDKLELFLISDENPHQTKESYLHELRNGWLQGGELELVVAADLLDVNIVVHNVNDITLEYPADLHHPATTHVKYYPGHYNYLAKKESL